MLIQNDSNNASMMLPKDRVNAPSGQPRIGSLWSSMQEVCDLMRIPFLPQQSEEQQLFQHVQLKAGQRIHRIGQPFENLYLVRTGFLKTVLIDEFGNEQVMAFPMKGDMIGIDAICTNQYSTESVALTLCEVIVLPFKMLARIVAAHPGMEMTLHGVLSGELVRQQNLVRLLTGLNAEMRVAHFLITLSERFAQMGYSSKLFSLRMTRQEIGSYLGLTLETVSRTLSAFNEAGFITVEQRSIGIVDMQRLKGLRRLPATNARARNTALRHAKSAAAAEAVM